MITSPMNDTTHSPHGSPHAPHTTPDPRVQVKPEYALSHSEHHRPDHTSSTITTNSPHTTPLHFDSPSPNPQLGAAQLNFTPVPTSQPSAPAPDTTIPLADDDSKYETTGPMPYHVPHPILASSPSSPYAASPSYDNQIHQPQEKQPHYENVAIVDATPIDMKNENYKLSPAAHGSTILQDLRNPRKKIFWVFTIIALAIFFGVLAATVWKPKNDKPSGQDPKSTVTTPPMSQDMFACLGACAQASTGCLSSCGSMNECSQKCASTLNK
ncbi:hypothetical protein MVEG_04757 [Podila verticillata NRRL 6337]|nr:hypothetical protein MVEG_04757 [Podila verticillata NRRL 6337]